MNKGIKIFSASLLSGVLGFAGCTSDPGVSDKADGRQVDVVISSTQAPITRTGYDGGYKTKWLEGDKLGVFAYDLRSGKTSIGANIKFDIEETATSGAATFRGTLTDPASGAAFSAQYCAYYPWQDIADADPAALEWVLPATQRPAADNYDGAADMMTGQPVSASAPVGKMVLGGETVPVNFIFNRPVAITAMSFANLPGNILDETIESIGFKVADQKIAGQTLIDLTKAQPTFAMDDSAVDNITLDYTGKDVPLDASFAAWIVSAPLTATSFDVVIETENYTIERTVTVSAGVEFKAAHLNILSVSLAEPAAVITDKVPPTPAPKAVWIDLMFTDKTAVNVAPGPGIAYTNQPLWIGRGVDGGSPTVYDPAIKMWTVYKDGMTTAGTMNSGGTSKFSKSYYSIVYRNTPEFGPAHKDAYTMEVYCKRLSIIDNSPFSGMQGGGFGFRAGGASGVVVSGQMAAHAHTNTDGTPAMASKTYRFGAYQVSNDITDYHHYLFTYDGANLITYMDGTLCDSRQYTGTQTFLSGNQAEIVVGGDADQTAGQCDLVFYGNVAFARVHNAALTAAQVYSLYEETTKRKAITEFDDLNTALTTTVPGLNITAGARKALLDEGWALMNDIATTASQITTYLSKVSAADTGESILEWSASRVGYKQGGIEGDIVALGPDARTGAVIASLFGSKAWTVDAPASEWAAVVKEGNYVKATLSEYTGAESRNIVFTVKNSDESISKTVTLIQVPQVSKTEEWTIEPGNDHTTAYPSNPFGNIVDGDTSTFWEYGWTGEDAAISYLPYEFVIDMQSPQYINTLEPSQAIASGALKLGTTIKEVKYEISGDGVAWIDLGKFMMSETQAANSAYGMKPYVHSLDAVAIGRYVRFTILSNANTSATSKSGGLAELDVKMR